MEVVAKQIQGSRFEIIPKAGNVPNMEQPEIFNELLTDFYRQFV